MSITLPYGTWPSRLSAADLATGQVLLADLQVDGERVLWTESRPDEGGRQALVAWDPAGGAQDLGSLNVRTRVHEYGGAPFAARDGVVVASHWDDQRLYRVDGSEASPVTPAPPAPAAHRYADGVISPDGRWLVCVREIHDGSEVHNEIAAVDLQSGAVTPLVTGRDFVAAPRLSPDGARLAWLAWDHPYMPWDAAELHVAPFAPSGGPVSGPTAVAGGVGNAANGPVWLADGALLVALDASGFWEVHHVDGTTVSPLTDLGADTGFPGWNFGNAAIAPLTDGRVAVVAVDHASCRLHLLDLGTGRLTAVELPYVVIGGIRPYADGAVFLGATATGRRAVVTWSAAAGATEIHTVDLDLSDADRPRAEPLVVPTPDGATTYAFLYRPASADVTGAPDERPPLVVFTHGGPTGNVYPVPTGNIAYWTTRGFAVADVNYRGSSGYGRAYRDTLLGRWGELDVTDTIAVARYLADRGEVDAGRMAIRGGSAGGYTTLAVLTTPGHPFACGTSFFGVADLALLAAHTHKFESRYLDRVVGPLPEAADVYRERSPLHRADRLSAPILVLQGLEDAVVPPEQAEAIVAAAAANGVPHAYIAFEGEQHGFRRAENIVTWLESELGFYGQVMGFEPAGDPPRPLTT
jgi:dipeptidyl aminopeptidase/acylaminoacyl peptidase